MLWERGCSPELCRQAARNSTLPRLSCLLSSSRKAPSAARHSSGLSVQSFLRGIHVIEYDEQALREVSGPVIALAHAEDLPGHADAIRARVDDAFGA